MSSFEELKKFVTENIITIILVLLLIGVIYVNMKINDLDYRLQQTIINHPMHQNDRSNSRYLSNRDYNY